MVWTVVTAGGVSPKIVENDYAIEYKGKQGLVCLLDNYRWIFDDSPFKYFRYIGSTVFFMLAFILGRCSLFRKADLKKILLCIPILVYDFGTMLLLSGGDWRFFWASFLVCPIVLLLTLAEENEEEMAI